MLISMTRCYFDKCPPSFPWLPLLPGEHFQGHGTVLYMHKIEDTFLKTTLWGLRYGVTMAQCCETPQRKGWCGKFWQMVMLYKSCLMKLMKKRMKIDGNPLTKTWTNWWKRLEKNGLEEEFACLPEYVNMQMQWSQIGITGLICKC